MIGCVVVLFVVLAGAALGNHLYGGESLWLRAGAVALGGIGGVVGLALVITLITAPFYLLGALRRVREPADFVCRCPKTPTGKLDRSPGAASIILVSRSRESARALEEGLRAAEWLELAPLRRPLDGLTIPDLRREVAAGSLTEERVALASALGDAAATALDVEPREPSLRRPSSAVPKEVQLALRSGLPPRLCCVWALSSAERLLSILEAEFHQDMRPRQALGAAVLLLRDEDADAAELLRSKPFSVWRTQDAGCRVVHRSFADRFWGRTSNGERAGRALFQFARAVADYAEPRHLWMSFARSDIAHAYATPRVRCDLSQPAFRFGNFAYGAASAFLDPEAERRRQREELARLVLEWETWDEDREAWRTRVEDEWIPRVERTLSEVPFDVAAYVEEIRTSLVPWRASDSAQAP